MITIEEKLKELGFKIDTFRGENKKLKYTIVTDLRTTTILFCNILGDNFQYCWLEEDNHKFNLHSEIHLDAVETFEQFIQLYNLLKLKD